MALCHPARFVLGSNARMGKYTLETIHPLHANLSFPRLSYLVTRKWQHTTKVIKTHTHKLYQSL